MSSQEQPWHATLATLVEAYDLDGLIAFAQQAPPGDAEEWRQAVVESGFLQLYAYLAYDQMCGKLGEGGLDFLDDVLTAAETVQEAPLHELRAQVASLRLEEVAATDVDLAQRYAWQAIQEASFDSAATPSTLRFRAQMYHRLAQLDARRALSYWQLALADMRAAGEIDVWILYHPWPPTLDGMPPAQRQARAEANQWLRRVLRTQPERLWPLLDEAVRMQQVYPSTDLQRQVTAWLQTALSWPSADAPPQLLRQAGLLLQKQGRACQRTDYLAKAIECFEQFIAKEPTHAFEVYYLASTWEDWAILCEKQGQNGTAYLAKAWAAYRQHEDIVRINFSPLLHYAELLERLHLRDRLPERPAAEQVRALASEAERMGNGYYSGPGMILVRLAIHRAEAETASYHLCRLLLRHELCIVDELKELQSSLTDHVVPAIRRFIDHTLRFMQDVAEGYYYHPAYTQEELNQLTPAQTLTLWQQRMGEIRSRRNVG